MMVNHVLQWRAQTSGFSPAFRRSLREVCLLGLVVVLMLPAARGHHEWLGWWPLWLVGMPLAAWWAAAGLPLPARMAKGNHPAGKPRRLPRSQARRRVVASRPLRNAVTSGRGRGGHACVSVAGQ